MDILTIRALSLVDRVINAPSAIVDLWQAVSCSEQFYRNLSK